MVRFRQMGSLAFLIAAAQRIISGRGTPQIRSRESGGLAVANWKLGIGAKLGVTSGLGVLLVAAMVISQQISGDSINAATRSALNQEAIAKGVIEVKASLRGMQMALRDLRLTKDTE